MEQIRLVRPTPDMETAALALKQEFYCAGERTIPGSYKLDNDKYTYMAWLHVLEQNRSEATANPKFGTSETYFAENEAGELVGILNLRHTLTPFYQNSGHIGYSVRPRQRGKEYATAMLSAALIAARKAGMREILAVCRADNTPSRNTILHCGGVLHRTFISDGCAKEEYTIQT